MSDEPNPREAPGANQLRDIVQRLRNLEEERRTIGEDIKELKKEAKSNGYTPAALAAIVKRDLEEPEKKNKREELEAIVDTYASALGIKW